MAHAAGPPTRLSARAAEPAEVVGRAPAELCPAAAAATRKGREQQRQRTAPVRPPRAAPSGRPSPSRPRTWSAQSAAGPRPRAGGARRRAAVLQPDHRRRHPARARASTGTSSPSTSTKDQPPCRRTARRRAGGRRVRDPAIDAPSPTAMPRAPPSRRSPRRPAGPPGSSMMCPLAKRRPPCEEHVRPNATARRAGARSPLAECHYLCTPLQRPAAGTLLAVPEDPGEGAAPAGRGEAQCPDRTRQLTLQPDRPFHGGERHLPDPRGPARATSPVSPTRSPARWTVTTSRSRRGFGPGGLPPAIARNLRGWLLTITHR